ncbi:MAG: hypothetical protein N2Z22_05710 [Turneriella sp.]|nr:hypothetical protein [Turneriella sp.]
MRPAVAFVVLAAFQVAYAQANTTVVTPAPTGTVVVSDTSSRQLGLKDKDNLVDRVTLIDGTVIVGKITEMNASRIMIKVSGQDLALDASRVEKVERNIKYDPDADKRRAAEVVTKDGSRYRGTITKADAATTSVQTVTGEVVVKNENIERIDYLDAEKARQADAIAARPRKWELSLKGGSMFYNIGTFNNLLKPGVFGFLQVEAPHFLLPWSLRLTPGLMAGYMHSVGKSNSSVRIGLFPGQLTLALARQIGTLPLDVFVQGNYGVSLTRTKTPAASERLALDMSYGAELGFKYHITPFLNAKLGALWLAVRESTATLNHVAAYLSFGWMF